MTRPVNNQFHCNNCGCWQAQETSFSRWIRQNPALPSGDGYCVVDQDFWIHRFKVHGNRGYQLLMAVEIKTMGGNVGAAQRDTLHIINQFLRNRRQTPTKALKHQPGNYLNVVSAMNGQVVTVRSYGMHVLTFSGLGPADSEWMKWDLREIDEEMLTGLLAFNIDPDSLGPLDLRRHHRTHDNKLLRLPLDETDEP